MKLRVGIVNFAGAFEIEENANGQYEAKRGFEYEFLKILAKTLNFTYDIVSPVEKHWGSQDKNGNWTGLPGMLQHDEADIVIDRFFLSSELIEVIDFSFPYQVTRITFAVKAATEISKKYVFFYPFDIFIWINLFIFIFIHATIIGFFYYIYHQRNVTQSLHFSLKFILENNNFHSSRNFCLNVFFIIYTLMMFVLKCSYSGTLLSIIISPIMDFQIDTFEDLVKACRRGNIKVTTYADTPKMLLGYNDSSAMALTENFYKYTQKFAEVDANLISYIKENFAFITGEYLLRLVALLENFSNQIYISSDNIQVMYVGIGFKKTFCYKEIFNEVVHRSTAANIYNKIFNDYMFQLQLKYPQNVKTNFLRPLSLNDLIGAFWILLFGNFGAILIFLFSIKRNKLIKAISSLQK